MNPNTQQPLFMSPNIPQPMEPMKQPKSKKKLFIIVGVLLLIMVLGAVIVAIAPKSSKSNTQSTQTNATADQLVQKIKDEKYVDAFAAIDFIDRPNRQRSVDIISEMKYLHDNYPLNNCTSDKKDTEITYTCKNDTKQITVLFKLSSNSPQKIIDFQLGSEVTL